MTLANNCRPRSGALAAGAAEDAGVLTPVDLAVRPALASDDAGGVRNADDADGVRNLEGGGDATCGRGCPPAAGDARSIRCASGFARPCGPASLAERSEGACADAGRSRDWGVKAGRVAASRTGVSDTPAASAAKGSLDAPANAAAELAAGVAADRPARQAVVGAANAVGERATPTASATPLACMAAAASGVNARATRMRTVVGIASAPEPNGTTRPAYTRARVSSLAQPSMGLPSMDRMMSPGCRRWNAALEAAAALQPGDMAEAAGDTTEAVRWASCACIIIAAASAAVSKRNSGTGAVCSRGVQVMVEPLLASMAAARCPASPAAGLRPRVTPGVGTAINSVARAARDSTAS